LSVYLTYQISQSEYLRLDVTQCCFPVTVNYRVGEQFYRLLPS